MTPDEIRALTDEQLDIAIAERVYGWGRPRITSLGRLAGTPANLPYRETCERPTQSWKGMRALVEAMNQRGWWCVLKSPFGGEHREWWSAGFTPHLSTGWNGRPDHHAMHADPCRACAEAALAAVTAEASV